MRGQLAVQSHSQNGARKHLLVSPTPTDGVCPHAYRLCLRSLTSSSPRAWRSNSTASWGILLLMSASTLSDRSMSILKLAISSNYFCDLIVALRVSSLMPNVFAWMGAMICWLTVLSNSFSRSKAAFRSILLSLTGACDSCVYPWSYFFGAEAALQVLTADAEGQLEVADPFVQRKHQKRLFLGGPLLQRRLPDLVEGQRK